MAKGDKCIGCGWEFKDDEKIPYTDNSKYGKPICGLCSYTEVSSTDEYYWRNNDTITAYSTNMILAEIRELKEEVKKLREEGK